MKKPVLIGSQALQHYGLLNDRIPADWDFIVEDKGWIKKNDRSLDLSFANSSLEKSNRIIFENSQKGDIVNTPLGEAFVVSLPLLKVMKIASLELNKIKNEQDLMKLNYINLNQEENNILVQRLEETRLKIKYQKENFFNKYSIERFIDHDDLHLFINKSPAYFLIKKGAVEVDERLFNQLSLNDKKLILWEEAFVLALERYLIPNLRNRPMFSDQICDNFFLVNKTSDPAIHYLNKLCEKNKLKDHPVFLQKWAISNYPDLINGYSSWWVNTFDNLDENFWTEVLLF